MTDAEPRFVRVSRRAFLTRTAALGALVTVPGLACAASDADVFASAGGGAPGTTTSAPAPATTPGTTRSSTPSTTAGSTSTTGATSTTTTTATTEADRGTFPSGGELVVAFTFAAAAGGRVDNPYIAVWVEDPAGELVATVSVWFQSGKGTKYLPDLRRWYAAAAGAAGTTVSGATRVAGSYTVAWDGTDLDGDAVPAGDYVLHIEAAREHGPYELVSGDIRIGDEPFQVDLAPRGELTAASAELRV